MILCNRYCQNYSVSITAIKKASVSEAFGIEIIIRF